MNDELKNALEKKTFTQLRKYIASQLTLGQSATDKLIDELIAYSLTSIKPLEVLHEFFNTLEEPILPRAYVLTIPKKIIQKGKKHTINVLEQKLMPELVILKASLDQKNLIIFDSVLKSVNPKKIEDVKEAFYYAFKKNNLDLIQKIKKIIIQNIPTFKLKVSDYQIILNNILYSGSYDNLAYFNDIDFPNNEENRTLLLKNMNIILTTDSENYTMNQRKKVLNFFLHYFTSDQKYELCKLYVSKLIEFQKSYELFNQIVDYFIEQKVLKNVDKLKSLSHKNAPNYIIHYHTIKEKQQLESSISKAQNTSHKLKL